MNLCWQHLEEAGGNSTEINGKPFIQTKEKNKIIKSYFQDLGTASVPLAKWFSKAVEVLSAMKGEKNTLRKVWD